MLADVLDVKLPRQLRSRWLLPAFASLCGMIVLAAMWIAGHPAVGLESLAIMLAFAVALLLGGRSETVCGLRGDGRDERFAAIDLTGTALAGLGLLIAVLVAFLVEVARGDSGAPFT